MLRIGPVLGGQCNLLELARGRVVADRHAHARRLQVIAQHVLFLGRRAFMHPEQADVLALGNEVGRAYVGGQHGFFNQPVRRIAGAGHDFFNAPGLVANDLGFGGFKIHRTARPTLL